MLVINFRTSLPNISTSIVVDVFRLVNKATGDPFTNIEIITTFLTKNSSIRNIRMKFPSGWPPRPLPTPQILSSISNKLPTASSIVITTQIVYIPRENLSTLPLCIKVTGSRQQTRTFGRTRTKRRTISCPTSNAPYRRGECWAQRPTLLMKTVRYKQLSFTESFITSSVTTALLNTLVNPGLTF